MRRKWKKPKPRGPMLDNSKSISVRMTEEQYQRLQRYLSMTPLPITAYFRKLIRGDRILVRSGRGEMNPHPGVNMIHSNVKQIARCPRAKELDTDAVAKLEFLADALCEQVYLLSAMQ